MWHSQGIGLRQSQHCGNKTLAAIFQTHDVLLALQDDAQLIAGACLKILLVWIAMHHVLQNLELFLHDGHGFFLNLRRITLTACIRIKRQSIFQIRCDPQVINDQTTGFVFVYPIHPCNGLHQVMAFHRLINVQRVHTGCIKTGKPHVAHNDQFQLVIIVFHALSQILAVFFAGMVFGNGRTIRSTGSHHHFNHAFVQIIAVPSWLQSHDGFIQLYGNAA